MPPPTSNSFLFDISRTRTLHELVRCVQRVRCARWHERSWKSSVRSVAEETRVSQMERGRSVCNKGVGSVELLRPFAKREVAPLLWSWSALFFFTHSSITHSIIRIQYFYHFSDYICKSTFIQVYPKGGPSNFPLVYYFFT